MTVEASYILPFVTLGIVFLLICGFYFYNVAYIHQTAYRAALRGAAIKNASQAEIEDKIKNQINGLLQNKLLMAEQPDYKVKAGLSKVRVTIEVSMKIPVLSRFMEKIDLWKIKADSEAVRDHPVEIIRIKRK